MATFSLQRGSTFRRALRNFLPSPVLRAMNKLRFARYRRRFQALQRKDLFSMVYQQRLFGTGNGEVFYSGAGSRGRFVDEYTSLVRELVETKHIASIVDLGCGDFQIGARVSALAPWYTGVDIVTDLIEHHQHAYGSERISFRCLDIVADPLPPADLCLIRQVFQHLNNEEIRTVLAKLGAYRYVLVTENVPAGKVKFPNVDHVHGPETRLVENSGVILTEPPFSQRAVQVWRHPYDDVSILLTTLLVPSAEASLAK